MAINTWFLLTISALVGHSQALYNKYSGVTILTSANWKQ
jgi:hypothetical protein